MRRILALVLAAVLLLPVTIPVSAAGDSLSAQSVIYDSEFRSQMNTQLSLLPYGSVAFFAWDAMDQLVATIGVGAFSSLASLERAAASLSSIETRFDLGSPVVTLVEILSLRDPLAEWVVIPHAEYGYVIGSSKTGLVLCNSAGAFPYFKPAAQDESKGGGKWIGSKSCDINGKVVILSEDVLANLCLTLNQSGETCSLVKWGTKYLVIAKDQYFYYCNSDGIPYVFRVDQNYAVDSPNNYYTNNEGDNIYNGGDTVNTTLIDNSSSVVWFPDGTFQYIDQLIYDESTKTYYVDAHSEYNTTNNTYISNSYYYEYHIDYTSITYIGATAEYDKEYYLYYELPDGRSSADLTAEDLEVLNVSMDVIPYVRTADDTSIRALYHFDGDTLDSSYWSYTGNLEWTKGASITYMEANAFNGALYLDENEHEFFVHLPGNLLSSDFTIQFRYYQSSTMTPVFDSTVHIGDVPLLTMNGAEFVGSSGTLASISVGTWQDVCLMRKSGTLYYFVNGVCYGSVSDSTNYFDTLRFFFGSDQQTYKYLDELRVLNKAAYDPAGYTPGSVPFDTNLALVLPDTVVPVADEYWKFDSEGNLFSNYSWIGGSMTELPISGSSQVSWNSAYNSSNWWYSSGTSYAHHITVDYLPECVRVNNSASSVDPNRRIDRIDGSGLYFVVASSFDSWVVNESLPIDDLSSHEPLTFSVLLSDGTLHSVTASSLYDLRYSAPATTILPNGGMIQIGCSYDLYNYDEGSYGYYLAIIPPAQGSMDIVYVELKEGETANTGHEFVSAVAAIDRADLDKATLAVRTDLEITGHQIGGVRPSLPTKGLVWALVESGRMTSLQIYNGQAWEEVDGRIWTGERWIPYYAFDILLLKDMYDVVESDPTMNPIYTETGFWKWLQDAWGQMLDKLDQIIAGLSGGQNRDPHGDCEHIYSSRVDREPGCADPGLMIYTCDKCGHSYTEIIDATGHDWIVSASGALTVNGSSLTLRDPCVSSLKGLTLYGKTMQLQTTGAQLLDYSGLRRQVTRGVTFSVGDNCLSFKGIGASSATSQITSFPALTLVPGTYTLSVDSALPMTIRFNSTSYLVLSAGQTSVTTTLTSDFTISHIAARITEGMEYDCEFRLMLSKSAEPLPYEPYSGALPAPNPDYPQELKSVGSSGELVVSFDGDDVQTLAVFTSGGLSGISVPSGGTYTDQNGQHWICDEVDFARGIHIQRIGVIENYSGEDVSGVFMSTTGDLTEGARVLYVLDSPIQTPLSEEQLEAFSALVLSGSDVVVSNDCGAEMSVSFLAGPDILVCSKCGAKAKDYGHGIKETDLFEALGDFIAEGIAWFLDLLTDLVDSLSGIVDTFRGYVDRVGALTGAFPAFFAAFFSLVPEDLRLLLWFALVGFVGLAVWRKVTR